MPQKQYKYKFSFVMPVYNVEDYLAETVESILAQTMDFQQNCEIIFVNDGSPDNSEEVCLRYQSQFPSNIKYIKQKNSGLSAARNRGIKEVQGKYVSFLDSDDKLSDDTLRQVYDFFESHHEEIDFVSIKLQYFEAKEGEHMLNGKFHSSRVIDIEEEYTAIQLSAASSFIKSEVFTRGLLFDNDIKRFSEDAKFMNALVLEKMAYGVVAGPTYLYRKRFNEGSIMDGAQKKKDWYTFILRQVYVEILEYTRLKCGKIPKYIQYVVMYELEGRFLQQSQNILTDQELVEYKEQLFVLLKDIDDDIILEQPHIFIEHKIFILSKKYGKDILQLSNYDDNGDLYYKDVLLFHVHNTPINVDFLEIDNGSLVLEGWYGGIRVPGLSVQIRLGEDIYELPEIERPGMRKYFLGELLYEKKAFKVAIPLLTEKATTMTPVVVVSGREYRVKLVLRTFTKLNQQVGHSYRVAGNYVLTSVNAGNQIQVHSYSRFFHIKRELKYCSVLLKHKAPALVIYRLLHYLYKPLTRSKKIWIISDRINAAGDNGEALFRYISSHQHDGIRVYFALSKSSADYQRMRKYGRTVDRDSLFYKILFLNAGKIISSHADIFVTSITERGVRYLDDLNKFDFVFLQHGITKDNISAWLNRYNKNIKLFVTAAKPEYTSILTPDYAYTEKEVKLTGFPRYDLLNGKPKNKLIIAPTWRRGLSMDASVKTGIRPYNITFRQSEYYRFYQSLISDERIIAALNRQGMTGEFYLHPTFTPQIKDFTGNDTISIKDMPYDYKTAFTEGSIMVTDYSSVAFDFAYLKKPIVYTQFDRSSFFGGHIYTEGYFSYEDDGFGPVCYDYDRAIAAVISVIESGCKMPDQYAKRVENFFDKFDKENSKRVYEAIISMDKRR